MNKGDPIFVAGHNGMLGSAIFRLLTFKGYTNLISIKSSDLDLRDYIEVRTFFSKYMPRYVFLAAAKVGGVQDNLNHPFTYMIDNLVIQNNIIRCSIEFNVERLLFISSSKVGALAMNFDSIHNISNNNEYHSHEGYLLSKLIGIKLIEKANLELNKKFLSISPSNIYGIQDNFEEGRSHVLASALKKIHNAKANNLELVEVWGDGTSLRDFIYVDDVAYACILLMKKYYGNTPLDVGTGIYTSIKDLYHVIANIIGYKGKFQFNLSKPNGEYKLESNIETIKKLGFTVKTSLVDGIKLTYDWYLKNEVEV